MLFINKKNTQIFTEITSQIYEKKKSDILDLRH